MAINEVAAVQGAKTNQTVEKKYDNQGRLISESIFKDVNGDGKKDLYKITKYYYDEDGRSEHTYIDRDGDGYDDYHKIETFNEKGIKVEEKEIEEEDINKVKNRNHFPWETENRVMENLLNGTLIC